VKEPMDGNNQVQASFKLGQREKIMPIWYDKFCSRQKSFLKLKREVSLYLALDVDAFAPVFGIESSRESFNIADKS
jgi:hypothetical protein